MNRSLRAAVVAALVLLSACDAEAPEAVRQPSPAQSISAEQAAYLKLCSHPSEKGFRLTLSPDTTTPSGQIRATGASPRFTKDGSYIPPDPDQEVHFWLNIGIKRWLDVIGRGATPDKSPGGNVLYLGHDDPGLCEFDFTFRLPDITRGRHKVLAVVFDGDGAAPYDDAILEVVPTPDCATTPITSDEYGTDIHPTKGPPGTVVTFSGTTVRGEDGRWAPSDRLEAWWNTDTPASEVPGGTPVTDGPVVRLVRVDDMERCRFETTSTVPDVDPGRYKISVFAWFEIPENGYGLFLPHHFTVTPSELPPCEDERGKSYGKEPPGLWLKDVLLELGAPGGDPLTDEEVGDTGTALVIDIYNNDPTIYASMLTKGRDPQVTRRPPNEKVGHEGEYELFFQQGNPWEVYKAVGPRWKISLIAYPGAGSDDIAWPDDTVEWLRQVVHIAEQSPPQCEGAIT